MANENYYRNMELQRKSAIVDNARNNSVKSLNENMIDVRYKGDRFRISAEKLKVGVVSAFLATAILVTAAGIGISKGIENIQEANNIQSIVLQESVVNENTHRTQDNNGYWYDTRGMALDILASDDMQLAAYATERCLHTNTKESITEVFDLMDRFIKSDPDSYPGKTSLGSYDEYVASQGGHKEYFHKMESRALATYNLQAAQAKMSEFDGTKK